MFKLCTQNTLPNGNKTETQYFQHLIIQCVLIHAQCIIHITLHDKHSSYSNSLICRITYIDVDDNEKFVFNPPQHVKFSWKLLIAEAHTYIFLHLHQHIHTMYLLSHLLSHTYTLLRTLFGFAHPNWLQKSKYEKKGGDGFFPIWHFSLQVCDIGKVKCQCQH